MGIVKRWAPVIATVVLSVAEVLESLGEREAASALRESVVSVSAASVALIGVGLKIHSQIRKYRERLTTVAVR